jgi:hypothetical protein
LSDVSYDFAMPNFAISELDYLTFDLNDVYASRPPVATPAATTANNPFAKIGPPGGDPFVRLSNAFWRMSNRVITGAASLGNTVRRFTDSWAHQIENTTTTGNSGILGTALAIRGALDAHVVRTGGQFVAGIIDLPGTLNGVEADVKTTVQVYDEYGLSVAAARQIGLLQGAEAYYGYDILTFEEVDAWSRTTEAFARFSSTADLLAGGLTRLGVSSTMPRGATELAFQAERAGGFRRAPYAPRTPNLPPRATIAEVLENGWVPGREGIIITDQTVSFSDMYRMTERTGIEYGLTRETIGGQRVFHLYSGGPNAVTMPGGLGVRNIGHTHPSGSRLPSDPDIGNINFQYLRNLKSDPYAPVPHRRVIYGPGDTDITIYYPTEMR